MYILSCCKSLLVGCVNYAYDMVRFVRYSQIGRRNLNCSQLSAKMMATSHVIEKGMSLPSPRLGYGESMVLSLIDMVWRYRNSGLDLRALAYTNALSVLCAYKEYHESNEYDLGEIGRRIDEMDIDVTNDAGTVAYTLDAYRTAACGDFRSCAQSRHTVRAYSGDPVPEQMVLEALEIAKKTPSVCNRQSWRVYWVRSAVSKHHLAELQNGHRGFGDQVDSFLIVTTDLHTFFGIGERNQAYVDGGLYSMSLLYALHYVGIGACPLNWCMPASVDRKLKQRLEIPANENVVLIISIGVLKDEIIAARSIRKSVEDTLLIR